MNIIKLIIISLLLTITKATASPNKNNSYSYNNYMNKKDLNDFFDKNEDVGKIAANLEKQDTPQKTKQERKKSRGNYVTNIDNLNLPRDLKFTIHQFAKNPVKDLERVIIASIKRGINQYLLHLVMQEYYVETTTKNIL